MAVTRAIYWGQRAKQPMTRHRIKWRNHTHFPATLSCPAFISIFVWCIYWLPLTKFLSRLGFFLEDCGFEWPMPVGSVRGICYFLQGESHSRPHFKRQASNTASGNARQTTVTSRPTRSNNSATLTVKLTGVCVTIRECTTRTLLKIVRPLKVRHNRSDFHDKSHPFRLMKQSTTQSGIATAAQRPRTSWAPDIKPAFLLWFIQKCETRTLLKVIQTFPARHNPSDFSDKSDPFRSIKQSTTESKMATTAQRPGTSWQEISPSFPWLIQKYKTRTLLKTPHPTFPYNTVNRLLQFIMPTWAESQ